MQIAPAAAGKRYLVIAGPYSNAKAAYTLRAALPQYASRMPKVTEEEAVVVPPFEYDASGVFTQILSKLKLQADMFW